MGGGVQRDRERERERAGARSFDRNFFVVILFLSSFLRRSRSLVSSSTTTTVSSGCRRRLDRRRRLLALVATIAASFISRAPARRASPGPSPPSCPAIACAPSSATASIGGAPPAPSAPSASSATAHSSSTTVPAARPRARAPAKKCEEKKGSAARQLVPAHCRRKKRITGRPIPAASCFRRALPGLAHRFSTNVPLLSAKKSSHDGVHRQAFCKRRHGPVIVPGRHEGRRHDPVADRWPTCGSMAAAPILRPRSCVAQAARLVATTPPSTVQPCRCDRLVEMWNLAAAHRPVA